MLKNYIEDGVMRVEMNAYNGCVIGEDDKPLNWN